MIEVIGFGLLAVFCYVFLIQNRKARLCLYRKTVRWDGKMTKMDYIMFALGAVTYAVAYQIAGVIL